MGNSCNLRFIPFLETEMEEKRGGCGEMDNNIIEGAAWEEEEVGHGSCPIIKQSCRWSRISCPSCNLNYAIISQQQTESGCHFVSVLGVYWLVN